MNTVRVRRPGGARMGARSARGISHDDPVTALIGEGHLDEINRDHSAMIAVRQEECGWDQSAP